MTEPYEAEILRWRAWRRARLTRPDGWLSLIALEWLDEGRNTIGADPSNRIVLPAPDSPPRAGSIDVRAGKASARFEAGGAVTHETRPVVALDLQDDTAGDPTVLRLGRLTFNVINREGRLALRVRDTDAAARRALAPFEYFPVDPRWRFVAGFEPAEAGRSMVVPTVLAVGATYAIPGRLRFEAGGRAHALTAFLEPGETDLFIVFGDRTNGVESYGGGRYLYTAPPGAGRTTVLDFNKSYNPPCVFSPYTTCALPLPENRLPIRVEAGEKRYRE
jgi:uncharacterized protein (DUF1684 family)